MNTTEVALSMAWSRLFLTDGRGWGLVRRFSWFEVKEPFQVFLEPGGSTYFGTALGGRRAVHSILSRTNAKGYSLDGGFVSVFLGLFGLTVMEHMGVRMYLIIRSKLKELW